MYIKLCVIIRSNIHNYDEHTVPYPIIPRLEGFDRSKKIKKKSEKKNLFFKDNARRTKNRNTSDISCSCV